MGLENLYKDSLKLLTFFIRYLCKAGSMHVTTCTNLFIITFEKSRKHENNFSMVVVLKFPNAVATNTQLS